MKHLILFMALLGTMTLSADDVLVRNPFWPQGYEGQRHPITLTPRFKAEERASARTSARARQLEAETNGVSRANTVDQARKQASEAAIAAENELWASARKTLVFGPAMNFQLGASLRTTITINGRIYGVGDYLSATIGAERFTWKIIALTSDGKITLDRVRHIPFEKRNS